MPNKDKDKEVISTQWEMGDVEKAGLLKMDFLGLRNLTSLAAAVKLLEKKLGKPFDLLNPCLWTTKQPVQALATRRGEGPLPA